MQQTLYSIIVVINKCQNDTNDIYTELSLPQHNKQYDNANRKWDKLNLCEVKFTIII